MKSLLVKIRSALPSLTGLFTTPSNKDFVNWDSGRANDRIILFSTDANFETLGSCEHWFADGTFTSSPALFDQFLVIHGYKTDGVHVICMPLVYVVTPNRITQTYGRVLEKLKDLRADLSPMSIMTDFDSHSQYLC
jgi:hypothetical protein